MQRRKKKVRSLDNQWRKQTPKPIDTKGNNVSTEWSEQQDLVSNRALTAVNKSLLFDGIKPKKKRKRNQTWKYGKEGGDYPSCLVLLSFQLFLSLSLTNCWWPSCPFSLSRLQPFTNAQSVSQCHQERDFSVVAHNPSCVLGLHISWHSLIKATLMNRRAVENML